MRVFLSAPDKAWFQYEHNKGEWSYRTFDSFEKHLQRLTYYKNKIKNKKDFIFTIGYLWYGGNFGQELRSNGCRQS